jgi:hypothetical protein
MKGEKFDNGKLPLGMVIHRQFPNALKGVSECSLYGHNKYRATDEDWCNLHRVEGGKERYLDALHRHLINSGVDFEGKDLDTGILHLKHAVWNALCLLEVVEREQKTK